MEERKFMWAAFLDPIGSLMRVLLFATAREAVGGQASLEVPGGAGTTVAEILENLRQAHPSLDRVLRHSRLALNGEYLSRDLTRIRLRPTDELAILPPYSGG